MREVVREIFKCSERRQIFIVLFLAFLIRMLFSFWGSKFYFGSVIYVWKDTGTYIDAFTNWYLENSYQFDFNYPDSRFFRVPLYPFFLGVFWINNLYPVGVAVAQVFIDLISLLTFYFALRSLGVHFRARSVFSVLYATYPFLIVWVPILYTEVLMIFLFAILFYCAAKFERRAAFLIGVLGGLLFLTKQYMILCLVYPISLFLVQDRWGARRWGGKIVLGVAVVVSPWIIRNYAISDELIISRGKTTGINVVNADFEAFESFANLFDQNVTGLRYEIAHQGTMTLEKHFRFRQRHQKEIDEVASLAHNCGSSFVSLREKIPVDIHVENCNVVVVQKFAALREKALSELNFIELIETRLAALGKVVVGNLLDFENQGFVKTVLYAYRFLIYIATFVLAVRVFLSKPWSVIIQSAVVPLFLTKCAFVFLFCLYYVHAEIRYLLMVDILCLLLAASLWSLLRTPEGL